MATNQLAKGLASLGRNGDSMLMHVTPREVAGLSHLAKSMGGEITVNPHTGLPEAGFFDFLTNMLPTAVALMLAAPTGGTSLATIPAATAATTAATAAPGILASMQAAPILGGMATGAAVAGAKGEDPLMGGLMGGISGVGAPGMADAFSKMGGAAATPAITSGQGVQIAANNLAPMSTLDASVNNLSSTLTNSLGAGTGGAGIKLAPMMNQGLSTDVLSNVGSMASNTGIPVASNALDLARPPSGLEALASGMGKFASDPFGAGYDAFKQAGGSGMQLAATVGLPALSAMQPEPYDPSADEAKRKAEENKYKDPITGRLNLFQSSPGLRLATGGTVNTNSSSIASGGIQDLYGTNDQTTGTQNLSKDGYGIGRLDNLASEGSRAKAADTFYAEGGPIAFANGGIFDLEAAKGGYLDGAGDGMSDSIPGTIEGKQPARLADGEFVVPADVVSHLGNGSSKAGAKNLYAMMNKVRKARTGNPKQGKQINPNKYMPA
jgi:hypothetical protein